MPGSRRLKPRCIIAARWHRRQSEYLVISLNISSRRQRARWEPVSTFEKSGLDALLDVWWARVEQDTGRREDELMLRKRVQASAEHIRDQIRLDDAESRAAREDLQSLSIQRRQERREQRQRERDEDRKRNAPEAEELTDSSEDDDDDDDNQELVDVTPEGQDDHFLAHIVPTD